MPRIGRRAFLSLAALGAAGAALPRCARRTAPRRERPPNILLVMADEHAGDVAGCYGDGTGSTPAIDRLAGEGVLFESCYTPSPLCGPARLAFLAGRHVSQVGVWGNNSWLASDDVPSIPHVLAGAGYEAVLGGKMHLDVTRRYGYRELFPSRWNRRFKTGLVDRIDPENPLDEDRQWLPRTRRFFRQMGTREDSLWMREDRRVTEECSRFLSERDPGSGPFFLTAGYYAPHYPLIAPEEHLARFAGKVPPPTIPEGHLESLTTNYLIRVRRAGRAGVTPDEERRARELYWARVAWLDEQVGLLLEALARSPVAGDTVVVYTADHGEMKGDHGLWQKNAMFEPAVRVPLILRWPERWPRGERRPGACSLLDLGRTLVELGGAEAPGDWNGRSLLRRLDDASAPWRDEAVSEFFGRGTASGFAMIRRGDFKYVYHCRIDEHLGPERELYDLDADPGELENLAGRAAEAARIEGLHAAMVRELGRDPEDSESLCREQGAVGYGRTRPEGAMGDEEDEE